MTFRDHDRARRLEDALIKYRDEVRPVPGIEEEKTRETLIRQIEDSIRRVRYVDLISRRDVSPRRADPNDDHFDPLRAAVVHKRKGNHDEAFWCAFLAVHFGKHRNGGWTLVKEFYNRLGESGQWDWETAIADLGELRRWLDTHEQELKDTEAGFGNHRKYESLDAYSDRGTGAAIQTYVDWIAPPRTHCELIREVLDEVDGDAEAGFEVLYEQMDCVASFGRLARFDYLTLIGSRKLDLAPIEPGSPYLRGATGALKGARLLFGGRTKADIAPGKLNKWVGDLDEYLGVGMQVLEDSLCNWQKSPKTFKHFEG